MEELIQQLTEKAGITPEQAQQALETVKDFIKEKFPMMAGAVDNLFPAGTSVSNIEDIAKNAESKIEGLFGGGK
ncbi:MAG TPA: hypothetical protein VK705_08960 [Ferruginibacter sp.]|jgi:hypothetical protein|nr:hypothetical protein [Ferruginibacter sp.]